MYPYDATPGLMQAFENLKSKSPESLTNPRSSNTMSPLSSAMRVESTTQRNKPGPDRTSSVTFPFPTLLKRNNTTDNKLVGKHLSNVRVPPWSTEATSSIERDRPKTAPIRMHEVSQYAGLIDLAEPAVRGPFAAYRCMSTSVGGHSPSSMTLPSPPSCPELEVYKRHESNGRLMVSEAREQHCSSTVTEFLGERTGLRGIVELKAELLRILGHLGKGGNQRAKADLKVVTVELISRKVEAEEVANVLIKGNMLERIVAWDLNRAEALEQPDVPLLSTIPTAATLNKVDAIYILKMFRLGMKKIPGEDIRSQVGRLPDQDLMALLHFTLLISRPVLVWELDLDEI